MSPGPGRPRIIETPDELARVGRRYRDWCLAAGERLSVRGLATFAGFAGPDSFYDIRDLPGFAPVMNELRSLIRTQHRKHTIASIVAAGLKATAGDPGRREVVNAMLAELGAEEGWWV